MNIALITTAIDGKMGGIGHYSYHLIKNLVRIDKENIYSLIHQNRSNNSVYQMAKDLYIPFLPIPFKKTINTHFILPKILKKYNFDVIHDLTQMSPFLFKSKSKNIITIHDLTPILLPKTHGLIHGILQNYVLRYTLKNIDYIIADSKNTKKDIVNIFGIPENQIAVIYLGLEEEFKVLNLSTQTENELQERYNIPPTFLLSVSTLEPRKNIVTLLKAYYQYKKSQNDPLKLVIIGKKGWKYKNIFTTINKLNLNQDVILPGYVDTQDLPLIYNMAQLFIYPSVYEGFGLPPLEAMGCGCPVITSNTSSLPEVVGDAGFMIDPYDDKGLAKAIIDLLQDPTRKKELISKGLEQSKHFKWEITAKETMKVYNK